MNRNKFKKEFLSELVFFNSIAVRDIENGFTITQVEDSLIKYAVSFYGIRNDYDMFALKKAYFISECAYQIIQGKLEEELLDELCDKIEEEYKVRVR